MKELSNTKKEIILIGIILFGIITPLLVIHFLIKPLNTQDNQGSDLFDLEKVDNHPLFVMKYNTNYSLENFLYSNQNYLTEDILDFNWACTCFATLDNKSNMLFGRNFDWSHNPALLLYTDPPNGYKSISMVDLGLLNLDNELEMSQNPQLLLRTPFFPLDGMNEYGLTIACMAIPDAGDVNDPEKPTLGSLEFIRIALDYAKSIEEVFDLWNQFNIVFPPGPDLHFLIADAYGSSAIIEWIEGEMKTLKNENLWQVSTNFVIYNSSEIEQQSCSRYYTCETFLSENEGNITEAEALNLLDIVSQSSTQWSAIYNMQKKTVKIIMGQNYNLPIHEFVL
ncbi:MAG: linear amide C-N hydrolase [Promethearchaeota archaeon]